jgi:hypothetical protein
MFANPHHGGSSSTCRRSEGYDRRHEGWAIAALAIVVVTIAVLALSPSWVSHGCNDVRTDCGGVPPVVVGLVGVAGSLTLLLTGALRSIR